MGRRLMASVPSQTTQLHPNCRREDPESWSSVPVGPSVQEYTKNNANSEVYIFYLVRINIVIHKSHDHFNINCLEIYFVLFMCCNMCWNNVIRKNISCLLKSKPIEHVSTNFFFKIMGLSFKLTLKRSDNSIPNKSQT